MSRGVPADDALLAQLGIEARNRAEPGIRDVVPGETLENGAQVALTVRVSQPAYVYVMRAAPDGSAALLFPEAGDKKVEPAQVLRIPEEGKWFELDRGVGLESVRVVASPAPLRPELVLAAQPTPEAEGKDDKGGDKDKDKAPCNPKGLDDCKRGGSQVKARADGRGIAVVRFAIKCR